MTNRLEDLVEDIEFGEASLRKIRRDYCASLCMAGTGFALFGMGVINATNGDMQTGIFAMGMGSTLAAALGSVGLAEVKEHADLHASLAVKQFQVDGMLEDGIYQLLDGHA